MKQPLSVVMTNTKLKLNNAFNQILEDSQLPAYLYEGLLLDMLSEIRNRKNLELVMEMNKLLQEQGDLNEGQD